MCKQLYVEQWKLHFVATAILERYSFLQETSKSDKLSVDVSPEVVKSIAQADLGRQNASNGKSKDTKDVEKQLSDQMVCC